MNLIKVIQERWKFYLPAYILGYVISVFKSGVPNWLYLFPINLSAIVLTIFMGNLMYHMSKKMPTYHAPIKGIKYFLIAVSVMICYNLIRISLMKVGIDITPLMGFF